MNPIALFIRHKPGQRDAMREIWEHLSNPEWLPIQDILNISSAMTSRILTLLLSFSSIRIKRQWMRFLAGAWYSEYPKAVSEVVAKPPEILPATLVWQKGNSAAAKPLTNNFVRIEPGNRYKRPSARSAQFVP